MDAIYIPISKITSNPRQPRSIFDASEMASLVGSVKEHGILQPLLVTVQDGGIYVLIAGERRLRAAKEAGLEEVPAVIVPEASDRDMLELALIENVQRADLNPLEKARAYQELVDKFDLSHEDVALRVGQHRSTVTNTLRLLKLPESIQANLLNGSISERQASALLALYDLPEPLRRRAETGGYDPALKPSNIESKVNGGASSDYVRDTIKRMLMAFGKRIIWQLDVNFAVPAERPSRCGECPMLIKGGDNLCGDEDCFHVRLNAYNRQSLPLPEPTPPAPKVKVEIKSFAAPEPDDEQSDLDAPEPPTGPILGYSTVTAPITDTQDVGAGSQPAQAEESEDSAPEPPASLVTAPPPLAPDWEHATLLITITYSPVDGHADGRPAWVGLRANNSAPAIRMCREKDTLLPGYLSGLLLDMETKFKEG